MSVSAPVHGRLHGAIARKSPLASAGAGGVVTIVNNGALAPFVTFARASTGTYFDSAGVMRTAAVNTPRIDYDPATLELRGLLVEEQRTNLLTRSNPDAALPTGWSAVIGTGTRTLVDSVKIPGKKAVRFQATAQRPAIFVNLTLASNTAYRFTLYVDSVSVMLTRPVMFLVGFDDATGSASALASSADSAGRVTLSFTTGLDVSGQVRIGIGSDANDTGDITITGWQLEAGTFATSLIETAGTTQTRAIDDPDFIIPPGIVRLEYTYDDDTTADVAVTPGAAYQIPTGQKRIKHLRGYRS